MFWLNWCRYVELAAGDDDKDGDEELGELDDEDAIKDAELFVWFEVFEFVYAAAAAAIWKKDMNQS